MIRTIVAAWIVLVSSSAFAADAQRYLVATKRPFRAGALAAVLADTRVAPKHVAGFDTFHGFAAELTESEVAALRASSEVRWIEPVIERHAAATSHNVSAQVVPYGIDLVHARETWAGQRVGLVNIAILDTGIDDRHDELKTVVAGGVNLHDPTKSYLDDGGHGTHVAGTIAAADNDFGVVGIAPQSQTRLWAVKVLNSAGSGSNETIVKGIDWVVDKKKQLAGNWIINLSLGAPRPSTAERESIGRALDAGIIIVAAAGNESTSRLVAPVIYPAAYPGVVAVGAIDSAETIAVFSNQGPELDVVAPGVGILSTIPIGMNFIGAIATHDRAIDADPLDASAAGDVTSEYVYCGLGYPDQFPPAVRGKIALIRRGELTFANKVRNAVEAGAIAAVIFNNVTAGPITWTLHSDDDPWSFEYAFPVTLAISKKDGDALVEQSGAISLAVDPDDYAFYNGTSMSTPHVAGAAALIWSMAPNASSTDVVNALTATAIDRGTAGVDPVYGAGVVDILAAAKRLAPSAFTPSPTTGRPIGKRR